MSGRAPGPLRERVRRLAIDAIGEAAGSAYSAELTTAEAADCLLAAIEVLFRLAVSPALDRDRLATAIRDALDWLDGTADVAAEFDANQAAEILRAALAGRP